MMKIFKPAFLNLLGLVILFTFAGCYQPTSKNLSQTTPESPSLEPTLQITASIPAAPQSLPFEGIWMNNTDDWSSRDKHLIVITDKHVYFSEPPDMDPLQSLETYGEILSYDLQQKTIDYKIVWVRANGRYGGFDNSHTRLAYDIRDNMFYFKRLTDEDKPPYQVESSPYERQ
ncbi:MAG: hypothetical protein LWX83_14505 [Anaerolineae bacterium]|nr:hypothetical protein [Anaerolineae bacterium]